MHDTEGREHVITKINSRITVKYMDSKQLHNMEKGDESLVTVACSCQNCQCENIFTKDKNS